MYDQKEPVIMFDHSPFAKTVPNFYQTDLITANSTTMGEASLFLNKFRNFSSN
jgi:hypothetical protein